MSRLLIRADGAARGNPGPAAAGAVLIDVEREGTDPDAEPIAVVAEPLGRQTNNYAEYQAVILALQEAHRLGAAEVELVLDSRLVVEQLMGRWKVREASLAPLRERAITLLRGFQRWTARHEPRASNRAADALANLALDDPAAARAATAHRTAAVARRRDAPARHSELTAGLLEQLGHLALGTVRSIRLRHHRTVVEIRIDEHRDGSSPWPILPAPGLDLVLLFEGVEEVRLRSGLDDDRRRMALDRALGVGMDEIERAEILESSELLAGYAGASPGVRHFAATFTLDGGNRLDVVYARGSIRFEPTEPTAELGLD